MADLDLQSFPSYKPVEASSELLNPPRKKFVILDQVTFFGLALSCGIPILSNAQGVSSSMSPRDAGSGVSFSVSGHPAFSADILQDFVNSSSAVEWFGLESPRLGSSMEKRTLKIVAKKVITASDLSIDDACYLAAITNEIRILSKQAIRECRQIVALHAISWNELPVFGRCWPQLYLQQADMGSLKNFLDQSDTSITTKMKLGSDIMAGLACVHSQGIVHLDLKPENILIFQDASIKDKQISGASPSVIAKISDFGSAVILADYEVTSFFQYRTGTVGWMSPEMDLAKPTPIQLLYKSDIFSCGLLAASLFAQGSRLLPSETQRRADSSSEADQVWERLCADRAIPDTVAPYVLVMLRASLSSDPGDRFSLLDIACVWTLGQLAIDHLTALEEAPRSYQLLMVENMHQRTVQLSNNPHAQFQHKMSTLVNDLWELFVIEDRDRPNWFTGTMRPLKDIGEWHALSEKGISRNDSVERIKFNDSLFIPDVSSFQLPAHAILNLSLTRGSHKFCFETKFSASTLPRVLVGEIIRNLEERSTQSGDQSKVCLSLAGYYLNETLIDQDVEKGMKYLAKAADQGHLAALEALGSFCTHFKNSLKDDFTESVNRIQISATTMLKGQVLEFNAIFSGNLTFEAHKSTMFIRARQESETSMTQRRDLLIFEIWSQLSSGRISDQSLGASETGDIQDPNQEDDDGIESILQSLPTTPLQRAVLSRDEKLIQRVVEISGGGLEEYGETPGWSPLWLSCLTGDYHTAEYLMQNGANINCSALDSGISILHLLNMFSEPSEIDGVLEFCLRGREDGQRMLVGQKTHKGLTPLHTTFCGYDYSCGYAARALLKHGASPITQTPNSMHGFTPIALCAFSLDYELLQEMLACVWITEESNRSDGVLRDITLCKAFAFRILCNLTQFVLISKLETFEGQLDKIVKLVLDDKTMEFLLGTESSLGGYDPLAMPLWQARPYLALSFLRVFGLPRQISMVEFQRPYLHIAIERRLRSCVSALLERGADILLESQFGKVNALHMAAIWFPEMLLELIDHVNLMNSEDRRGKSAKQILESVTDAGVDVISLLIMEGNKLELDVADKLRRNYNIDLDVVKYQQGDESVTLTGKVVAAIMEDGLIPLSQVEYLLKLKPPPRLVCSSNGRTLLCLASTGRLARQGALTSLNHQLLRMLLQYYPGLEDMTVGLRGQCPLHMAAAVGNIRAIQIIEEHVRENHKRNSKGQDLFTALLRQASDAGSMPLDSAMYRLFELNHPSPETSPAETPFEMATENRVQIATWKYLRSKGAVLGREKLGRPVRSRMTLGGLVGEQWTLERMDLLARELCLESDTEFKHTLIFAQEGQATAGFTVILLTWIYDKFQLLALRVVCAVENLDDSLEEFRSSIFRDNWNKRLEDKSPDYSDGPWTMKHCTETVPWIEEKIDWERTGSTLDVDQVRTLVTRFDEILDNSFNELAFYTGFQGLVSKDDGFNKILVSLDMS